MANINMADVSVSSTSVLKPTIIDEKLYFPSKTPKRISGQVIDMIICHHSAIATVGVTAKQMHDLCVRVGKPGVGFNYYVMKDGTIHTMRPMEYIPDHTGISGGGVDFDKNSIGIVWEGDFNTQTITPSQSLAGINLIAYLVAKYPLITMTKIRTHKELIPTATCPGKNFNLTPMVKSAFDIVLASASRPTVVAYTPNTTSTVYVVVKGDTLSGIAKKFGVALSSILALNPKITDPSKIYVGQQIILPTTAKTTNSSTLKAQSSSSSTAVSVAGSSIINIKEDTIAAATPASTSDNSGIKFTNMYQPNYEFEYYSYLLPGYSRCRILIKESTGKIVTIPFFISPNSVSESRSNNIRTMKTTAGWFIAKLGENIGQLSFSGYMLDSKNQMERHAFLEAYKNKIVDRINSKTKEYETNLVSVDIEGMKYNGYISGISFSKAAAEPFLYQYSIQFLYLSDVPTHGMGSLVKETNVLLDQKENKAFTLSDGIAKIIQP